MNDAVQFMLKKYKISTEQDLKQALHEIIQEISLLGLWRSKFFEHAAFYGGTALRILYGLERFSEDLDFTLLKSTPSFSLKPYFRAVELELKSYGFDVEISEKIKKHDTAIESAFIKADTLLHMIKVGYKEKRQSSKILKIKLEIDRDPPLGFSTESKYVLQPVPFSIVTLRPEDLFAGKMHALLFRRWQKRVKGRDWYDLIWYVGRGTPMNLIHLEYRIRQSHKKNSLWNLTKEEFYSLLRERIDTLDFDQAIADVQPFIRDFSSLEIWSKDFFHNLVDRIKFV